MQKRIKELIAFMLVLAVLLGRGAAARHLKDDDVYVIPVGALGP